MCQPAIHTASALSTYRESDPTRTITLRRNFARQMRVRFTKVIRAIQDALVNKDVLGLTEQRQTVTRFSGYSSGLGYRAFDFPTADAKINAFMDWLREMVDSEILEVSTRQRLGQSINVAWTNVFIEDAYKRGVLRATYEMRRSQFPNVGTLESRGGMSAVLGGPIHADRLGILFTRTFNDLKGITDAMDNQISRVLTQGMADGDGPRLLARKLRHVISGMGENLGITDTLGRYIPAQRRAEILARTETIRAHHQAMVQEYRNFGLVGVRVQAEFKTAGDDRVCPQCQPLEGNFFTLDEIQNMIPVHPQCRCIALPARREDIENAG